MVNMETARNNMVHPLNLNSGLALKTMLREATIGARTHDEVCMAVSGVVRVLSMNCNGVGFVSAVIGSEGKELVDRNIAILGTFTDHIRGVSPYPVISAADVFHRELLDQYRSVPNTKDGWFGFWRKVLGSGVSDLFMTPRWEISAGARDEYEFAKATGIRIHYRHEDSELVRIMNRHRKGAQANR